MFFMFSHFDKKCMELGTCIPKFLMKYKRTRFWTRNPSMYYSTEWSQLLVFVSYPSHLSSAVDWQVVVFLQDDMSRWQIGASVTSAMLLLLLSSDWGLSDDWLCLCPRMMWPGGRLRPVWPVQCCCSLLLPTALIMSSASHCKLWTASTAE